MHKKILRSLLVFQLVFAMFIIAIPKQRVIADEGEEICRCGSLFDDYYCVVQCDGEFSEIGQCQGNEFVECDDPEHGLMLVWCYTECILVE